MVSVRSMKASQVAPNHSIGFIIWNVCCKKGQIHRNRAFVHWAQAAESM